MDDNSTPESASATQKKRSTKGKREGRYRGRYYGPDGREHEKLFDRAVDRDNWVTTQKNNMLQQQWIDPAHGKRTIGPLADKWLETKSKLKPKTVESYKGNVENHIRPRWGKTRLDRFNYLDYATWIAQLPLKASGVHQVHTAMKQILDLAVKGGMLPLNPIAKFDSLPKRTTKEMRFLTAAEVEMLAKAVGEHYTALIYFLAYTGVRWGEATRLTKGRLNLMRRQAHIAMAYSDVGGRLIDELPKNHQRRWVPIPPFLNAILTDQVAAKGDDDLVFTTEAGYPLRNSNFRHYVFDKATTKIGIPELTPHELRHTAASLAIAAGASIKAVQKMLGHETAKMTFDLYGHLYPDEMDALGNLLDKIAQEAREHKADVRQLKEQK